MSLWLVRSTNFFICYIVSYTLDHTRSTHTRVPSHIRYTFLRFRVSIFRTDTHSLHTRSFNYGSQTNLYTEEWHHIHNRKRKKYQNIRKIASLRLPEKDNELVWEVSMKSHPDSLCEGLMWSLVFDFRDTTYPFEPPKVTIHSPLNRLLKKAYVVSSSSSLSLSLSLASQHAMANSYHTVRGICTCVR